MYVKVYSLKGKCKAGQDFEIITKLLNEKNYQVLKPLYRPHWRALIELNIFGITNVLFKSYLLKYKKNALEFSIFMIYVLN